MKSLKMLADMQGRTALVAGGTGFLGMAMGEAMAEAGADVIVLDLDGQKADDVADQFAKNFGGQHKGLAIDLAEKESIETVPDFIEKHFGQLDVLVNCAALVGDSGLKGWAKPFKEQDIYTWEKAINVNLTGAFYLIQQCQDMMEKSAAPSIINSELIIFAGASKYLF